MHETDLIELVAVGLGLAFVFGALANRLRLSPLVGYLVAGILVGPFTPGFVADQELALQLSELGVMLLMFGVGLHFSLDDLIEVRGIAIPGAVGQMVVATLLGSAMAAGLGWTWAEGLVFGLALSVASTVVLLRALDDRRLLETSRGRIAIGWLIVEDLVTVLALVLLPALAGASGGDAGSVLVAVGRTVLSVTGFVLVMLLVGRRVVPWTLERVAATGSRELFTLAVLAIALGVAFASALLFNVSFALGAFFAGMLLNGSELSAKAANDSLPLRDAFAVLFFVSVGMLFDPDILVDHPWQVVATVSIVIVGKSGAAYGIVRLFRHRADTAMTVSVSLAQIGEFSFVLAALAVSLGLMPDEGRDLVVAGALISILVNPFLFTALDRRLGRGDRVGADDEAPTGPVLAPGHHAIVIGYGRVGSVVADDLERSGIPVIVVDEHEELVEAAHRAGIPGIRGNATADAVLAATHPETARIAVVAIPQPLEAGEVLVKLRGMNPSLALVARAHSDGEVAHLLEHGADDAVMAERELAHSLAERVVAAFADGVGDGAGSTAPLGDAAHGRG